MTRTSSRRRAAGLAALAVAAAALGVWAYHEQPLADRVDVGEATPQALDTLRLTGRQVTASLGGTVQRVDADGAVYVGTESDAFPVRGDAADSLARGDRVFAFGRIRDGLYGRYLDAEALTVVTVTIRPGERRSGERPTVQLED